jgi:hypothetical protein
VLPLTLLFFFISCRDDVNTVAPSTEFVYENVPWNSKGKLLEKFGIGISKAMYSEQFRRLIRNEAIKRFNRDTDVLYTFVKDVPINSTAQMRTSDGGTEQMQFSTLHEFLVPFFGSEAELVAAEQRIPLLTIFVPTLPEDSFSPELWDVSDEEQIPDVALALDNISYVPVIGREGEKYLIEPGWFPGYPIVVLKENERVITDKSPRFDELDTRILNADGSSSGRFMGDEFDEFGGGISNGEWDHRYRFRDNNFDPDPSARTGATDGTQGSYQGIDPDNLPDYLVTAYKTVNPLSSDSRGPIGWQRDYIYYGITQDNPEGRFVGQRYRECIATFRLNNFPSRAYRQVTDSFNGDYYSDPKLREGWLSDRVAFTDGAYEFEATIKIGNKDSQYGKSPRVFQPIEAEDLFEISWKGRKVWKWPRKRQQWSPTITETKTVNTATRESAWMFGDWGIETQATQWYITFQEVDSEEEQIFKSSQSAEYATNFELTGNAGQSEDWLKIGFKYGRSSKRTQGSEYTVKRTVGSDMLLDNFQLFFGAPMVEVELGSNWSGDFWNGYDFTLMIPTYQLVKIPVSGVEFSFVPVQVN